MAKPTKKKTAISQGDLESELNDFLFKTTGVEIQSVNDVDVVTKYIDTGNYSLNYALTGNMLKGLPAGRIYTLEGESGRGKSLQSCRLAIENVREDGISIIADIENAINGDFLRKIAGGDAELVNRVKVVNSIHTIEDLQNFLNQMINFQIQNGAQKELLFVVDSWSILSSKHEQAVVDENEGKKDMSKAVAARMLLRALSGKLKANKITLVLVMHLTTNIGVMFGEKMIPTSHGNAAIFMSSTRTQLYATEELEDKNGNPIGTVLNFKTKKNRFTYKNKTAKVAFYFSGPKTGIDRWSGVVETLVSWGIFKSSAKKITATTKITWDDHEFKASEIETFATDWDLARATGEPRFIEVLNSLLVTATEGAEKDKDLKNFQDDEDALEEAV